MATSEREPVDLAQVVAHLARALLVAAGGNDAPHWRQLHHRMHNPQPGDLVVEFSARTGRDPDSMGWLLRVVGNVHYPQLVELEPLHRPGETVRWRNASFLAVPTTSSTRWLAAACDGDTDG